MPGTCRGGAVPVVDLFAGPGGLGEGFAALGRHEDSQPFRIVLSIENNPAAHQTLELRSFFRQFPCSEVPASYYHHLRGAISRAELFDCYPEEAARARAEAWQATLGEEPRRAVDRRIRRAVGDAGTWVLVGGPPCQAYSTMGRSRNKGIEGYRPEEDRRHYLYREYLRIIAGHWPPVFVMENVKGLLSTTVNGERIFGHILQDLRSPRAAVRRRSGPHWQYRIFSLEKPSLFGDDDADPNGFLVKAELHGIPQARHRLFLLGIREDLSATPAGLPVSEPVHASRVLSGLPRLRSGLSQEEDSPEAWRGSIRKALNRGWLSELRESAGDAEYRLVLSTIRNLRVPRQGRGNDVFLRFSPGADYERDWFIDPHLMGVCNHATREHVAEDLHRYLFAACFGKVRKRSPSLRHFPKRLLPKHKSVKDALSRGDFADRFRVQVGPRPATTVTSHIAKDGHYYIHPDPGQCRSLTVREAARLQTFPDNYFFCGPRTAQYRQVGNAVPPLLAVRIADVVLDVFKQAKLVP